MAVVTASGAAEKKPQGAIQAVICAGKTNCRKTRATSTGLNGLNPSPPKSILPRQVATAQPASTIQAGAAGGRVMPRSSPVSAALPAEPVTLRPVQALAERFAGHAPGGRGGEDGERGDAEVEDADRSRREQGCDHRPHDRGRGSRAQDTPVASFSHRSTLPRNLAPDHWDL